MKINIFWGLLTDISAQKEATATWWAQDQGARNGTFQLKASVAYIRQR